LAVGTTATAEKTSDPRPAAQDQRLREGRSPRTDGHSNATNHRSEGRTALGDHSSWDDAERIAVNVGRLYREFADDDSAPDVRTPLGHVAELGSS